MLNRYNYDSVNGCVWLCLLTNGNVVDVSIGQMHDNHHFPVNTTADENGVYHTVTSVDTKSTVLENGTEQGGVFYKLVGDSDIAVVSDINSLFYQRQLYPFLPQIEQSN